MSFCVAESKQQLDGEALDHSRFTLRPQSYTEEEKSARANREYSILFYAKAKAREHSAL